MDRFEVVPPTVDEIRANLRKAGIGYTGLSGTNQHIAFKLRDASQDPVDVAATDWHTRREQGLSAIQAVNLRFHKRREIWRWNCCRLGNGHG